MPEAVPSPIHHNWYPTPEGTTPEENAAQACLSSVQASDGGGPARAPSEPQTDAVPRSPAVDSLVSRFTKPPSVHPPAEPSLARAVDHCAAAALDLVARTAAVLIATPETLGTSLIASAVIVSSGANLVQCIRRDEAAQVAK